MRSRQAPLLRHLGKILRGRYDPIISERVPERWIDLINFLNEKERSRQQDLRPGAKPGSQRGSKPH